MKRIAIISIFMLLVLAIAANAADKLNVKEIEVKVDGEDDTLSLSSPSFDFKAQNEIVVKITIANDYTSSEDITIENIDATATFENLDEGNDFEVSNDNEFDLDAEDEKTISFKFNAPLKLEDDKYDLVIEFDGKDENSTKMTEKITITANVDRSKHELMIYESNFTTETLVCERQTKLVVGVINIGEEEEDATISVTNDRLGVKFEDKVTLDENPSNEENVFDKEYDIDIKDAVQGTYAFTIKAVYSSKTVKEDVNLYVHQCEDGSNQPVTEEKNETLTNSSKEDTNVNTKPSTDTSNTQNTNQNIPSYKVSSFDTSAIIIALEIIVIVLGIVLIVFMYKKRSY